MATGATSVLRSLQRGADDAAFAVTIFAAERFHHDAETAETVFGKGRGDVALRFGGNQEFTSIASPASMASSRWL